MSNSSKGILKIASFVVGASLLITKFSGSQWEHITNWSNPEAIGFNGFLVASIPLGIWLIYYSFKK